MVFFQMISKTTPSHSNTKTPKFDVFIGERDPRQHLINFREEYLLKLESEEKMMVKLFHRSLNGDVSECFYKFPIDQSPHL